jgi:alpha-galactosidase
MALRYLCCLLLLTRFVPAMAQSTPPIAIETEHVSLVLAVGDKQRIFQTYLGPRLAAADHKLLPNRHEAYVPAGTDNLFEPALRVVHADGNPSLALAFADVQTSKTGDDVITTTIHLRDPSYPVDVRLHFTSYYKEDVIKTWTEITHREHRPVVLTSYASAMLHFDARQYWLTQFHGDWAEEAKQVESQLTSGIKIIDTKLGTRAGWYQTPSFFLGLDKPAEETTGEVLAGSLAWTGNFRLAFELDNQNSLRVSAGINPYASEYTLPANQPFVTPEFIFTYSATGKGQASRNLHRWARQHGGTLDGTQPRLTLLNNWESTFFDFNEAKLDGIMADAAKLGVDLFLLDDGWFGNKYPRNGDTQGLGDWQPTKTKLPNGVGHLVKTASKEGIKFGIWLEPEMVNPKSELAEKHPDWLLKLPNRPDDLYRNQLVLDLNNPKVQDFVYRTVDEQLSQGVAYVKWDCNRMISSGYSQYLGKDQSHLSVD